jgi:hypothetical protein
MGSENQSFQDMTTADFKSFKKGTKGPRHHEQSYNFTTIIITKKNKRLIRKEARFDKRNPYIKK